MMVCDVCICFFFKQKTADELRISDWSSDVCSSDLNIDERPVRPSNEGLVPMQTARTLVELRAVVGGWRTGGHSVALVPTMGALHAGHLRLVEERSEEHTSELQSLMRISYAVFCLKKKKPTDQSNASKTSLLHSTNKITSAP